MKQPFFVLSRGESARQLAEEEVSKQPVQFSVKKFYKGVDSRLVRYEVLNKESASVKYAVLQFQSEIAFKPAQNLLVYPRNSSDRVSEALLYFGIEPESVWQAKLKQGKKGKLIFPSPVSAGMLLSQFVDISGPPSAPSLEQLSGMAGLKVTANKEEYQSLVNVIRRLGLKLTLQEFLSLSQAMKPRYYTVCGSGHGRVQLLVKVEDHGLVSSGLGLEVGQTYRLLAEQSAFKNCGRFKRMLLLGTGSGIAPYIALLRENSISKAQELHLFYGCRTKKDLLFGQQLTKWLEEGVLASLAVSYSEEKQYVAQLVQARSSWVSGLLGEEGTGVSICGGTASCKAMEDALRTVGLDRLIEQKRVIKESFG